jgi:pimeloyl-ACP methyl ester carboxylesterase
VLLLAPTSLNNEWKHPKDGDHIIARMAEAFNTLPVDRRRIYLFGHSLGGFMALDFGFANKNAIAAVALHSSTMGPRIFEHPADPASRRLPVGVWSGGERSDTSGFCCATGLEFAYREHPNISVQITVIPGHCHNDIYSREGLTGDIWEFLKDKTL